MSARQQVVDVLRPEFPAGPGPRDGWDVLDFERELKDLRRPVLMVGTQKITKGPTGGLWECELRVFVVAPHESFEACQKLLEPSVVRVLNVLDDAITNVSLGATAVTLEPKFHAYRVDLTVPLQKEG